MQLERRRLGAARGRGRDAAWPASLAPDRLDAIDHDGPFLAVDPGVIEERHRQLVELVPGLQVFYAVKCNPSPDVLRAVRASGAGFEVASRYELDVVRALGATGADVLYSNPVKPSAHIAQARARGVDRFAVDSEPELRKVAEAAPGSRVYVRLTVADDRSLFPLSKKFGTSVAEAVRLLVLAPELGLVPYGVTFHVGSQCTDPGAWGAALARCGQVMREVGRHGIRVQMVDIGGGLPARYGTPVPTLAEIAGVVVAGVERLPYRPALLCAEPGRYLVAESAVLAATVIGVEDRGRERWAYLDVGGYNGLMEAVQTGGRWHPPMRTSRADDAVALRAPFTITGPSCDSSDTVFHDALLPAGLAPGDRLYLGTAGAYTLSYASHFNGFPPPEVLVVEGAVAGRR